MLKHFARGVDRIKITVDSDTINGWKVYYLTKQTIFEIHNYLIDEFTLDEDKIHPGTISDGVLEFMGVKRYLEAKNNHWDDIIFRGANMFNNINALTALGWGVVRA